MLGRPMSMCVHSLETLDYHEGIVSRPTSMCVHSLETLDRGDHIMAVNWLNTTKIELRPFVTGQHMSFT